LITKAVVMSINGAGNRCKVRMPLFESAASSAPAIAEALVNIPPGIYSNLKVGDVVFVSFEENAIEKPIILGKLFTGSNTEKDVDGGMGILDTLLVRTAATQPCTTLFEYPSQLKKEYIDFNTPKKLADYIKWLEKLTKHLITQLYEHFLCFKNWTQWQFKPENVEVDDGDLDTEECITTPFMYQEEGSTCKICGNDCKRNKKRSYLKLDIDKKYPD
jgi:hypothetical protein